jgi:hypothetical protein
MRPGDRYVGLVKGRSEGGASCGLLTFTAFQCRCFANSCCTAVYLLGMEDHTAVKSSTSGGIICESDATRVEGEDAH